MLETRKGAFCKRVSISYGEVWGRSAPSVNLGPPSYLGNYWSMKVEILHTFRQGQVLFSIW